MSAPEHFPLPDRHNDACMTVTDPREALGMRPPPRIQIRSFSRSFRQKAC